MAEREATQIRSVLQVADYGANYSGTFIASLRALARTCERIGFRTVFGLSRGVAGQRWTDDLRDDGFELRFLDPAASLRDRARAIGALAAQEGAAIVHTHFGVYDVPAAIAALRARRPYAVVWHRHNGFPPHRPVASVVKDAIKLRVLGRAVWTVGVSQALTDEAVAHGSPPNRTFRVDNAIDIAHVTAATAPRDALRARMGIDASARVVLVFGWDPLRKGVDVAIEALRPFAERSAIVLLLVGGDALDTFVREHCAGDVPRWVRTVRPQEAVADFFAVSDVFLSASRDEGFSYALGEALANGLPSVVSDIPSVGWARDGGAFFYRPGNPESLGNVLAEALNLPSGRREAIARSARAFADAKLSLEGWVRQVTAVYVIALRELQRNAAADSLLHGAVT